jgi:hypothetical protein
MRRMWLGLILAGALFGADVSPTLCEFNQVANGPNDWACAVTITGAGAWTASSGATFPGSFNLTSGSGSKVIYLRPTNGTYLSVGVHSYTDMLVAGVSVTATITVLRRYAVPLFGNNRGVADADLGCTIESGQNIERVWHYNDCALTNSRPGGTYDMPVLGASAEDEIYGFDFTRIASFSPDYTNQSVVSSDNAYYMTRAGGTGDDVLAGIYSLSTHTKVYAHPRWNITTAWINCQMSSVEADSGYCWPGTTISKFSLGTPPNLVNEGAVFTDPEGRNVTNGYSDRTKKGDWVCAFQAEGGTYSNLYAIDLQTGKYASYDLGTLSPSIVAGWTGGDYGGGIDYCIMSVGKDPISNKRYVWVGVDASEQTNDAGRVFSVDDSAYTMAYEGARAIYEMPYNNSDGPTWNRYCTSVEMAAGYSECMVGGHATAVESADGTQFLVVFAERIFGNYNGYASTSRFRSLAEAPKRIELGGGHAWTAPSSSHHAGALTKPYIIVGGIPDSGPAAYTISSCSGSSPVTCNTSSAHGYSDGYEVLIGGATGMVAINGVQTLATAAGSTFTINIATSGTYIASSAAVTRNVAYDGSANQNIYLIRVGNDGRAVQVLMLGKNRSVHWNSDYCCYPMPNISSDGSIGIYNSNGGVPNESYPYAIWHGMTAFYDHEFETGRTVTVTPSDVNAEFSIIPPASLPSLDCTVSVNRDLTSGTTKTAASGNPRYLTFDSLTEGTLYHWRCNSPDGRYVALGSFTALAPVIGGWLSISGHIQIQ